MYKFIKIMAVSLNIGVLTFFVFFTISMMEVSKAGNTAGAETAGPNGVELITLVEKKKPQLVASDKQALCMALNIYY